MKKRFLHVFLLWAAMGLASVALPPVLATATNGESGTFKFNLAPFMEDQIIAALFIAVIVAIALLALVERGFEWSEQQQANKNRAIDRFWDEISSACIHVACASFVVSIVSSKSPSWSIVGYFVVAVFCFNAKESEGSQQPSPSEESPTRT